MSLTPETFKLRGFGKTYSWIDLVNSEEYDGFGFLSDHLADASWTTMFLKHWSLGSCFSRNAEPRTFNRMRSFLRRVAETIASGRSLSSRDLKIINNALRSPVHRFLRAGRSVPYSLEIVPFNHDWHWVQAEIFKSLAAMLAEGQEERLKICPNSGCRWVFFDQTHGNRRKWCSDLRCGNRDKVRRFRERRAASRR